jgi:hypothetical protein
MEINLQHFFDDGRECVCESSMSLAIKKNKFREKKQQHESSPKFENGIEFPSTLGIRPATSSLLRGFGVACLIIYRGK